MSATGNNRVSGVPRPVLGGFLLTLVVLLSAALSVSSSRDVVTDSLSWSGTTAGGLAWPALSIVVACSVVHYLAAAAATRAATRAPLPVVETVLAQLCAAAANKLTPAGLGGSAVLARFLYRKAGLSVAGAAGTVSLIALGRAVAGLLTLALLTVAGSWIGLGGGSAELGLLAHEVHAGLVAHPWLLFVVLGVVGVAVAVAIKARATAKRFIAPLRDILRCPGAAAALLAASAMQTLVLGSAFAAAVHVLPGDQPHATTGALIVGYIAAAAAAAALPTPGGLGSSEAALTAVLVASHLTLSHAVADVLVFRIVTLWLPAVAGLPCLHILRRRHAL